MNHFNQPPKSSDAAGELPYSPTPQYKLYTIDQAWEGGYAVVATSLDEALELFKAYNPDIIADLEAWPEQFSEYPIGTVAVFLGDN